MFVKKHHTFNISSLRVLKYISAIANPVAISILDMRERDTMSQSLFVWEIVLADRATKWHVAAGLESADTFDNAVSLRSRQNSHLPSYQSYPLWSHQHINLSFQTITFRNVFFLTEERDRATPSLPLRYIKVLSEYTLQSTCWVLIEGCRWRDTITSSLTQYRWIWI